MPRRPTIRGPLLHPSRRPITLRRSDFYDAQDGEYGNLEYEDGGGASGNPVPSPESEASDAKTESPAAALPETKSSTDGTQSSQNADESLHSASKMRESGAIVPFERDEPVSDDDISDRARQAIGMLNEEFAAASGDRRRTAALWKAVGLIGRPSGSSPPLDAPPWSEHKATYLSDGKSAVDFVIDHFSKYFGNGFTRASLRQDPQLYTDVMNRLRTHPVPENLAPHFLTKKQLNDNRLAELGGRVSVEAVPNPHERHRLTVLVHQRRHG